jgi:glutamine synthetase
MSVKKFFETIKENEIEFVDFRFTDSKGKWHHTAYIANKVDETLLNSGIMFDGSSILGWKEINDSDMMLMPDLDNMFIDPFTSQATLVVTCDVVEPETGAAYIRDPRSTAKRAENYLAQTKIGDKAFFGPELEFFIFDDVRYKNTMNESFVKIDSEEAPHNSEREYAAGNYAHRPQIKGGYFPVQPIDSLNDIRAEMLTTLKAVGLDPLLHHHEVAPSQCELGFVYDTLVATADNVQKYKYVVHNVAHSYGKTATFMPKPIKGDNGSGMHVHQSIWKGDVPLFAGNSYAGLSEECLYYIGGIIKHAKALNAFTNPSTNSYKRLVPGFEAPVILAYSSRNRSASIRIPYVKNASAKRIEVRFPDATANPYYAFAALLMAGLDGIQNKIHPGDAIDKNLYDLAPNELQNIGTVSTSLKESLQALDQDREFLKKGGVFNDDQIDAYIKLKSAEADEIDQTPHPLEFKLYYSM